MEYHPITLIPEMPSFFNIALQQMGEPLIQSLQIQNPNQFSLYNLTLEISSDVEFFDPMILEIGELPEDDTLLGEEISLKYHPDYLVSLTESLETVIYFSLCMEDGTEIASCGMPITISAYNEWAGMKSVESLPCYVMPNHPAIAELLRETSDYLKKTMQDPSLEGYQVYGIPDVPKSAAAYRIYTIAKAAYQVIQSRDISYSNPPASFSLGQRLRTPDMVLNDKLGTCIDMSILYASVLEGMGLYPLLFLCEGHCYAGVWLTEHWGEQVIFDNPSLLLRYALHNRILIPVECTKLCREPEGEDLLSFDEAMNYGMHNLVDTASFQAAIDINRARNFGILPIPLKVTDGQNIRVVYEDPAKYPAPEKDTVFIPVSENDVKEVTRFDVWENKLLDLTPDNRLVYLPGGRSMVPFFYGEFSDLLKRLQNQEEFLITDPDTVKFAKGISASLNPYPYYLKPEWSSPSIDHFYGEHKLVSFYNEASLAQLLPKLYKNYRKDLAETGSSSLFLTIGSVAWVELPDGVNPANYKIKISDLRFCPSILVPVELLHEGRKAGYTLRIRKGEISYNRTQLELLRQQFDLDIPELEQIAADGQPVNISYIFAIIQDALKNNGSLDFVPTCCLADLSFDRVCLWNDIHDNRQLISVNPLIRGLMEGKLDLADEKRQTIETKVDEQAIYLPLSLDSSQLHAVKRALQGDTFVLQGPPGTGKSQVITAILANAVASGKKVLFVAEKGSALNVVKERLDDLGLGNYLLPVSGEPEDFSGMISLFQDTLEENALSSEKPDGNSEDETGSSAFANLQKTFRNQELPLDEYTKKVYTAQKCGLPLREMIDRYLDCTAKEVPSSQAMSGNSAGSAAETVTAFHFSPAAAADWTEDTLEQMDQVIRKLFAASDALAKAASKRNQKAWENLTGQCRELGLTDAVQMLEKGDSQAEIDRAYQKGKYQALIQAAFAADSYFDAFSGTELDVVLKEFQEMDARLMTASRREISRIAAIRRQALAASADLTEEWNLMKKMVSSGDESLSIHDAFLRMPKLLYQLYPCFLMSPDTVSRYLPCQPDLFDLVIFDEASQLETCKAIGAIARGSSAVIAGDSNQLPPPAPLTPASFESTLELQDLGSILEDVQALSVPCETLRWHYRSSHESLIAFCNETYYKNRIYTFPSADGQDRKVRYRNVGGTFKNNANKQEALTIVEELKKIQAESRRTGTTPDVGIIAFSKAQTEVIQSQIEKACRADADFRAFIHNPANREIFVKDLENVQGDERDIILFSVAYGPGEDHKAPSYRFGKIDGPEGWKKLNVAFSRARKEMQIFASIHGNDIPITRSASRGKCEIKAFLNYAESGSFTCESASASAKAAPVSGIREDICRLLEANGYSVTRDLGRSSLRIDAAVSDSANPDTYQLGILIDGFSNGESARDRYATPQQTLTSRGWKLYQIWALDWLADPEGEGQRLLDTLKENQL